MAKTFSYPIWLQGTKEQQKAESERQALALASFGRGHLSEAERLVGRGALLEQTAAGNLELTEKNSQEEALALSQLADAKAMQGKYAEAAEIHPYPVRAQYFQKIVEAVEMPDEEKCGCADTEARLGDTDIAVTPRFESARIFSPLHGEVVSLVECSSCGHQNARPLTSRLLKANAARAGNEAIAKGGRGLLSDVQVLAKK